MENCDEVEYVLELSIECRGQRYRIHEVDYDDKDHARYYEYLYLSSQEAIVRSVYKDQQVIDPLVAEKIGANDQIYGRISLYKSLNLGSDAWLIN